MKYKQVYLLYAITIILLFLLLIATCKINENREKFLGYGNVFGIHSNPNPNCKIYGDCHPGYYYRSQQYQNMCEPNDTRLTRERINLIDNCSKSLQGHMTPYFSELLSD